MTEPTNPQALPSKEDVLELYRHIGIATREERDLVTFNWIPNEPESIPYPFANQVSNSSRPLVVRDE